MVLRRELETHRPGTATAWAYHNGGVTEKLPWQRRSKPLPEPHLTRLQARMAKGQSLEEAAEGVGLTLSLAKSVFIRSGLEIPKPIRRPKKRTPDNPERVARIVAARALGKSLRTIAEAEDLSASRINAILAVHAPSDRAGRIRRGNAWREQGALGKQIHAHLIKVDSAPASEVAAALGVTTAEVRKAVWPKDRHRLLGRRGPDQRFPDAAIIIGLQIMSLERGRLTYARGQVPVSAAWWDARRDPAVHPPSIHVRQRFGTWSNACRQAGIPLRNQVRPMGRSRRWTDEAIITVLREFLACGVGTSSGAYQEWSADRPDTPSLATVMLRFGGWIRARSLAFARPSP